MRRYAIAPLALVAIMGLALLALAFIPTAHVAHVDARTLAYWVFYGHT